MDLFGKNGCLKNRKDAMSKLPTFASEQEEAEFWDTHDSTEFLDETEPVETCFVDQRPLKKQITIRLEPSAIAQIKKVASGKGIGYQTLIRMWVMEQLQKATA
jgi:predicted DNA binding CopG/RHH family protein